MLAQSNRTLKQAQYSNEIVIGERQFDVKIIYLNDDKP